MANEAHLDGLNAKYGAFVVTRFDRNKLRSVAIPGQRYPNIQAALRAAARLEKGKRYAGQFLMVDVPVEAR